MVVYGMRYRKLVICFLIAFLISHIFSMQLKIQASEMNLVKVYDTRPETLKLCNDMGIKLVEAYPTFLLIEANDQQTKWLKSNGWYYQLEKDYQVLRFFGHSFISQADKSIQIPSYLRSDPSLGKTSDLFLIQWVGPEKKEWLDIVKALDVNLLIPVHQYGWLAHMHSDSESKIKELEFIRSCGLIPFASKIHIHFENGMLQDDHINIQLLIHPDFDISQFVSNFELDEKQVTLKPSYPFFYLIVQTFPTEKMALLPINKHIYGIEHYQSYEPFNHRAARVIGTQRLFAGINTAVIPGLDGSGEIAGVADTGIRSTHPDFWDPTFQDKVIATFPTNWDDYHSHGTHVSGTVCGTGASSTNQQLKGIAYKARLVSQNFLGNQSYYASIGGLYALLQEAYLAGARTHNNSWGYNWNTFYHRYGAGEYGSGARDIDRFLWDNMDFTMVKSAGNNRANTYSIFYHNYFGPYPFPLGTRTITADSNAKNIICVGALENENGTSGGAYSWRSPQLSIQRYIAYFSSTGPTHDNRIKPDVVAPGDPVESCNRNHLSSPFNPYRFMSGTSMSSPVVTGAATLIRQYYRETHLVPSNAISSALVKATLINGSAQGLHDSDFPASGSYFPYSNEAFPLDPNPWTGFGLINVKNSILPDQKQMLFINAYDPQSHQLGISDQSPFNVYYIKTNQSNSHLKATLAWTDYADEFVPPNASSTDFYQKDLINDLHFEITNLSTMDTFRGNQMLHGFSIPNPSNYDHVNNVEQIVLPGTTESLYRIVVFSMDPITSDAAHGYQQPYALVLSGENIEWIDPSEVPSQFRPVQPMNFKAFMDCQGIHLNWSPPRFLPKPNYYLLTRRTWTGAMAGQQIVQRIEGNETSMVDTSILWGSYYYYILTAYDANDQVIAYSPGIMTGHIIPPSRPLIHAAYLQDTAQLYWNRPKEGTCPIDRYYLYRSSDPYTLGNLIAELPSYENNFVDKNLPAGQSAYYSLVAVDSRDVSSLKSYPVEIRVPVIETMLKLWIEPGKTELCPNEWLTVKVGIHNPHEYSVDKTKLIIELPRNIIYQRSDQLRGFHQPDGSILFDLPTLTPNQSYIFVVYFKSGEKIPQESKAPIYFVLRSEKTIFDQVLLPILLKKCQQGLPSPYLSIQLRNLITDPTSGQKYLPLNQSLELELSWFNLTSPFAVNIDWGDGNTDSKIELWENKLSYSHPYGTPGKYRCNIKIVDAIGKEIKGDFQIEVR